MIGLALALLLAACGEPATENTSQLDVGITDHVHEFDEYWYAMEEPSCLGPVLCYRQCLHCDYIEERMGEEFDPNAHLWSDWKVICGADCGVDELSTRFCEVCGETQEEVTAPANGNHKFSDLIIPESVTVVDKKVFCDNERIRTVMFTTEEYVDLSLGFPNCKNLTKVVFKKGVRLNDMYGSHFEHCSSLTSITMPFNLTISCFSNCTSLMLLEIPDNIDVIPAFAFCCASSLQELTIPGNVQTIGWRGFLCCTGLQTVTL